MAKARGEMNQRMQVRNQMVEAVQKLDKETKDPLINDEIRKKKIGELQAKLNELRSAEQEIQDFSRRRQEQIANEQARQRRGLYQEVLTVVQDRSKASGYDLVIDKSAVGFTQMNVYLFVGDKIPDFTNEVILELNKDAPPESATPAAPADPAAPAPPAEGPAAPAAP
jgi:Skp family chaperone for outer membrane proteins